MKRRGDRKTGINKQDRVKRKGWKREEKKRERKGREKRKKKKEIRKKLNKEENKRLVDGRIGRKSDRKTHAETESPYVTSVSTMSSLDRT